jgi:hypothetical protein
MFRNAVDVAASNSFVFNLGYKLKSHGAKSQLLLELGVTLQHTFLLYDGVFKSFRTGRLEQELQMVQLSVTRCSCIAIL